MTYLDSAAAQLRCNDPAHEHAIMDDTTRLSDRLTKLVGAEHDIEVVSYAMKAVAQQIRASGVGAYQIRCSDESEKENVAAFHRIVVRELLPDLKFWSRSSFRTTNLGGQYEEGALAVAESHFATLASSRTFKTMLIKLNTHVAVRIEDDVPVYGSLDRYDRESACCGALHAVLQGSSLPFAQQLRATFGHGGLDRLAILRDPEQVDPAQRALLAALCASRLQADRLLADLLQVHPKTQTVYLVAYCVTINREDPDTEILCGCVQIDTRTDPWTVDRVGLGSDPASYEVEHDNGRMFVREV